MSWIYCIEVKPDEYIDNKLYPRLLKVGKTNQESVWNRVEQYKDYIYNYIPDRFTWTLEVDAPDYFEAGLIDCFKELRYYKKEYFYNCEEIKDELRNITDKKSLLTFLQSISEFKSNFSTSMDTFIDLSQKIISRYAGTSLVNSYFSNPWQPLDLKNRYEDITDIYLGAPTFNDKLTCLHSFSKVIEPELMDLVLHDISPVVSKKYIEEYKQNP